MYEGIDSVILPVTSEDVVGAFERLGFSVSPSVSPAGFGAEVRKLEVGGAGSRFHVEFMRLTDAGVAARHRHLGRFTAELEQPRGLLFVALRVHDLRGTLEQLAGKGIDAEPVPIIGADGTVLAAVALLPPRDQAVVRLGLVEHTAGGERPSADAHALPVKRLDHLAAVAPDLEGATRFWTETLGVPVFGEVRTPAMIIRQFKIGDAILELLGPTAPDSPVASRPPGLVSMIAVEVPDLEVAVARARAAGFSPADPATGVLPGTRTATVPAAELGGLALQMLEYVN